MFQEKGGFKNFETAISSHTNHTNLQDRLMSSAHTSLSGCQQRALLLLLTRDTLGQLPFFTVQKSAQCTSEGLLPSTPYSYLAPWPRTQVNMNSQ